MSLHVGDHDQAWERTDYISNTPRLVHSQVVFEHLHLTTQTPNEHHEPSEQDNRRTNDRPSDVSLGACIRTTWRFSKRSVAPHRHPRCADPQRTHAHGAQHAAQGPRAGLWPLAPPMPPRVEEEEDQEEEGSGGGGEAQLLGFLSDGRDPLEGVLDVRTHGLALLYILCVACLLFLSSLSLCFLCLCFWDVVPMLMLLMLILGCSSARINGNFEQTAPPTWPAIRDFCRFVDPKHAALAPERGTRCFYFA